jgi:integral membrane protein (TIGR01906 family)
VNNNLAERFAAAVATIATPFVVVAVAVMLFLNPIWVGFDQDRSDVTGLTGYTHAQVQAVTGSILSDLVFGPPSFDVAPDGTRNGTPVLDERARNHMKDVRTVLMELGLVALIAGVLLAGVALYSRGRRWFWRGVQLGAKVLIVGVIVVGGAFALFFEQAFDLFHEIFFPPGTYMFDSATDKLVQLFPDQFWSETSVAIAVAVLALGILVAVVAGRLGREPDAVTGEATSGAPGESTPSAAAAAS